MAEIQWNQRRRAHFRLNNFVKTSHRSQLVIQSQRSILPAIKITMSVVLVLVQLAMMSLPMRKTSYSRTMTIFHHPRIKAKQVSARTSTRSSTSVRIRSRRLACRREIRVLQCRTMLATFATLLSASPTKTTHSSSSAIHGQLTTHNHRKRLLQRRSSCRIQTFSTRLISGTISR